MACLGIDEKNVKTRKMTTLVDDLVEHRCRMLNVLQFIQSKNIRGFCRDGSIVEGEMEGVDSSFSTLYMKSLKTPIGVYKAALLRTSDFHGISIDISKGDLMHLLLSRQTIGGH